MDARRERIFLGLALGAIGVTIFGATLPMTRIAVQYLDPWFVTLGRAAGAGLIAGLVLIALRRPVPPKAHLPNYLIAAAMLTVGFPGLVALAMVTVPSAHGGVVLGILPLATAVASAVMTGERPALGFWAAALVGAGLVIAFTLREAGSFTPTVGDLLLLAAVICTAIGYTSSAVLARSTPGWEVVSWMLVLALPVTLPAAILLSPATPQAVPTAIWAAFAYVTLFSQYIGFFFWNSGLAIGGIARVGQVQLLQTFVTLAIAAALVGERVGPDTVLFALAVVATVVVGTRFRSR